MVLVLEVAAPFPVGDVCREGRELAIQNRAEGVDELGPEDPLAELAGAEGPESAPSRLDNSDAPVCRDS